MENDRNVFNDKKSSDFNGNTNQTSVQTTFDLFNENFNYDGYQVVRGEFFSHVFEPSITFNDNKVYLNTACLKKLPHVDYVQILINSDDKKLAIRPSNGDERDSFLWCSVRNERRKPKYITCRIFFAKVFQLMDWNPNYRYRLLGKLIKSGDEYLFTFDLNSTIVFQGINNGAGRRTSKTPVFPSEWENQFGLPIEEHRKLVQVNIFKGYTVFGVSNSKTINSKITTNDENGTEVTNNEL